MGGIQENLQRGETVAVTIVDDLFGLGGGTQYTEGDVVASIKGTAIMWEDTGNVIRAVSAGKPLPIDIISPGISATSLGKAEDAPHTSGDVGVMSLAVRSDTPATTAADGDYHPFLVSEEGGLWTEHLPNEINASNSSTSTLIADAVFTGAGVNVLNHDMVTVTLDASHDSATDGLSFQLSTDNINWDDVYPFTYTAADGARRFQFPITAQYFRVVYTNGSTGQTHFRMQTLLHHGDSVPIIHRLVDDTSPDRSSQIVKAAIIAQRGGGGPGAGDFIPVQATTAGNLKMSVQEISDGLDIGAGNAGAETQRVSISTDDVNLAAINLSVATPGGRAQEPTAAPDEVANDAHVDRLHDRVGRAAIYQGYPRWYAVINDSTSGNNTILAAQAAGKKILVTSMMLVSDGTVDVRFESGADGTALTGQVPLQAREGFNGCDVWGSFETAAATLLNLELSAAINVHGWIAGHIIDD